MKTKQRRWIQLGAVCLLGGILMISWWALAGRLEFAKTSESKQESFRSEGFKVSDRTAPDGERSRQRNEAMQKAAQKWYEDVLEQYPDLKPHFRDVPDEENGYLQFFLLADSVKESLLPENLRKMIDGDAEWDPAVLKAWLAEHQDYADQILRMAELPDHSAKGIDYLRFPRSPIRLASEFGTILSASARLAFESGDSESALRYAKALTGLSGHFSDIEMPSMLTEVVAIQIRNRAGNLFFDHVFADLADQPDALKAWRDALFREEEVSSEYGRALIGEWNVNVRGMLLPALLGGPSPVDGKFQIPDIDAFLGAYASMTLQTAAGLADAGPGRLDLSLEGLDFLKAGLSEESVDALRVVGFGFENRSFLESLGAEATRGAIKSAAISIMLGEELPVDPVTGQAFLWDPVTRTLTAPPQVNIAEISVKVP